MQFLSRWIATFFDSTFFPFSIEKKYKVFLLNFGPLSIRPGVWRWDDGGRGKESGKGQVPREGAGRGGAESNLKIFADN